ncbi:hypothetical protein R6Q59_024518 [Mikania micrantha]
MEETDWAVDKQIQELDLKIKDAEIVLSELEEKVKKGRQEVEIFKERKQNLELYGKSLDSDNMNVQEETSSSFSIFPNTDFIKRKSNNCRYCKKTFGFITEVEKHESVCIQNVEAMMGQNHVLPIEA